MNLRNGFLTPALMAREENYKNFGGESGFLRNRQREERVECVQNTNKRQTTKKKMVNGSSREREREMREREREERGDRERLTHAHTQNDKVEKLRKADSESGWILKLKKQNGLENSACTIERETGMKIEERGKI